MKAEYPNQLDYSGITISIIEIGLHKMKQQFVKHGIGSVARKPHQRDCHNRIFIFHSQRIISVVWLKELLAFNAYIGNNLND